ncbi:Os08g0185700 [Oryza sativa Japonica Group]|uniref:Os08g0185700 protein n=1 Tax=Oryza sativa subsp. japonica TaxID=39947 RepID=A0A0N7KPD7_ORYSJ|nr:Os08g0185700 [Oryza sativa Japonica Group]
MVTSIGKDSTSGTAPPGESEPRRIELVRRTNALVTRSISSNLESSSSDLEIKFLPQGSNALPARIKRIGCMDGGMELQKRLCYFAPL